MKRDIRGVFFDLDDTLCDYVTASRTALRKTFEEHNIGVPPDKAIDTWRSIFPSFSKEIKTDRWYEHYLESGETTRTEHMRRTLNALGIECDELAKTLSKRYAELRLDFLKLYPEAKSLLSALKGSYRLGLITNGPMDVQRQEIERLGIQSDFDTILIEGELKVGKPDPAIFYEAQRKTKLDPSQLLFVGNAFEHDVQGAKNAGWYALWFNSQNEENPGTNPQPDAEIHSLYEVCDFLKIPRPSKKNINKKNVGAT